MNPEIQLLLDELASTAEDPVRCDAAVLRVLGVLEDQLHKIGARHGVKSRSEDVPARLRAVTLSDAEHSELARALGQLALDPDARIPAHIAITLLGAAHPFYAIAPAVELVVEHHRRLDGEALRVLLASLDRLLEAAQDSQDPSHAALVLALYDPQRALGEIAEERAGRETEVSWLHGDEIAALACDLASRVDAVRAVLHADADS